MASLNKVIIIGHLGRDPEIKNFNGGTLASFSVACSEKFKNKEGQIQEVTEWVNVTFFGKLAELCQKYISKGSMVYIEGRLKTDSYEKNGQKLYSTKVIGQEIKFLSKKGNENKSSNSLPDFPDGDVPF